MRSSLDEFLDIGADHRPDSIAVVFTDITKERSNMYAICMLHLIKMIILIKKKSLLHYVSIEVIWIF